MSPFRHAIAALAAGLALSSVALAQDVPLRVEEGALVVDLLGHRLDLPLPPWLADASAPDTFAERVSTRFTDDGSQGRVEIYPRGEGEAFWTRLYGIRITRQALPALADFRSAVVGVYARTCQPAMTAFFQLEADAGDVLPPLGFVCGAYLEQMPGYEGKGEVMVMGFYKTDTGMAMAYQEWRGDAFDPTNSDSWPVTAAEVEAQMALFKSDVTLTLAD